MDSQAYHARYTALMEAAGLLSAPDAHAQLLQKAMQAHAQYLQAFHSECNAAYARASGRAATTEDPQAPYAVLYIADTPTTALAS